MKPNTQALDSRSLLALPSLVLSFAFGLFGAVTLALPASMAWSFEVRAHRGGRVESPENLIPAFAAGTALGSDSLELDIHFTRDGQIVVSHDADLARRCKSSSGQRIIKPRPIITMTLKEIKEFDCGSLPDSEFPHQTLSPGAKIPTLNEVFNMMERTDLRNADKVKVAIEIKIWPDHPEYTPSPNQIAENLVKLIEDRRMSERVVIISFNAKVLQEIYNMRPKLALELLVENAQFFNDQAYTRKELILPYSAILPYWEMVNKNNIASFHKKGVKVIPWFPNKKRIWSKLMDLGVDGITTDDPRGLLAYEKFRRENPQPPCTSWWCDFRIF